ncbi:uncharacterized protein LOC131212191 [Anopheles bellator]|uniref:uncharacterized protein LOC131212191 n=1 Tax=Anopheles bellator TaxID=139047 RepID=UPI002649E396|nr:uncharacterized protein LOC131212191 [Anopheles bellator]
MGALGAIVVAIIIRLVVGSTMDINLNQPDAQVYHRQDMKKGEFDYGYHVQSVNNQFQHKVKGPDDVTYGCYGYVDPSHRKHLVYYVADRMGYRIIFPNRPTKIFSAKLADSLNKLDGAVKGKDYDERVVEWNNLYMPDSCFRLNEILDTAASNQSPQQQQPPRISQQVPRQDRPTVQYPAKPAPAIPQPTQYTIPTTPAYTVNEVETGDRYQPDPYAGGHHRDGQQPPVYQGGVGVIQVPESPDQSRQQPSGQPQTWQGSLPDINPANINLDQFNGQVYPIHTGSYDGSAQEVLQGFAATGQFASSQYNLNVTQLLAQIEAVNSQVITLNMLLAGMAANPTAFANANESSCRSVVQLLKTQNRTPQLVYVPILIPYVQGQYNINQPIGSSRPEAYQSQGQPGCKGCHG